MDINDLPVWICVKQISQVTGHSLATAYAYAADGTYPPPQQIMGKKRVWHRSVIAAYMDGKLEAQSDGNWVDIRTNERIAIAPGFRQPQPNDTIAHKPAQRSAA